MYDTISKGNINVDVTSSACNTDKNITTTVKYHAKNFYN